MSGRDNKASKHNAPLRKMRNIYFVLIIERYSRQFEKVLNHNLTMKIKNIRTK